MVDWLTEVWDDQGSAIQDVTLLRLRTLLCGARGEVAAYRDLVKRYRVTAERHGLEGHLDWADKLTAGAESSLT